MVVLEAVKAIVLMAAKVRVEVVVPANAVEDAKAVAMDVLDINYE